MRIIKRLDIFIFKNFIVLFIGTFAISLFVVMMQFLWKYIDDLVGKGLGIDVLGKFFFYAAETLVPMALPLAVLLAALISFGNLGERLELIAIKAAGISLWRTLRPLALLMTALTIWSFYFQDVVAPKAQNQLMMLIYSMRQKSPEVEIPEGVFYDGVEGMNLFVQSKDKETGRLYGVIIYNMRDGVNNAHIILADSGRLESSADKQHLLLHLYMGEQFENLPRGQMRTQEVPYRRETFVEKHFIIDFNQNFDMADVDFSSSARTKDIATLERSIDSLAQVIDSTSRMFTKDMKRGTLYVRSLASDNGQSASRFSREDTTAKGQRASRENREETTAKAAAVVPFDTLFNRASVSEQHQAVQAALQRTSISMMDMEYKADTMKQYHRNLRMHKIQIWQKITLALACLVFFFIGAPLGAIIRKGGLGMPVVVAVIIFIFYYIINSLGYNLAYAGTIPPVVGMWFSTVVLAPIGIFFTVKSNNDSAVFNIDAYSAFFRRLWGIRPKRHIVRKEVIINDPDYTAMAQMLDNIAAEASHYRHTRHLGRFPNYYRVFFVRQRDEEIERISQQLEYCVDSLSNSKDRHILRDLNAFPVLDPYAHTAPFRSQVWNIVAGVVFPIGIVLVFRMARFRVRLRRDLKQISRTGEKIAGMCRRVIEKQEAALSKDTGLTTEAS